MDSTHVHAMWWGEHGDSEVLAWSQTNISNISLENFLKLRGAEIDPGVRDMIDHEVRDAAYNIIAGKGATYYGVGSALADHAEHPRRSPGYHDYLHTNGHDCRCRRYDCFLT
ncbi:MAG: hypothetical protein R3C44_21885 [Chloroflexota bacterium]